MDILHLIEFAFTVLTSWTLGAMVLPRISLVSFRRRLFDSVDGRKLHTAHIPRLGGGDRLLPVHHYHGVTRHYRA